MLMSLAEVRFPWGLSEALAGVLAGAKTCCANNEVPTAPTPNMWCVTADNATRSWRDTHITSAVRSPADPLDGIRHGLHGVILTDHPLVQLIRQMQQLLSLAGHQLADRDACG